MLIRAALPDEAQDLALLGMRLWRETYMGLIPDANIALHLAETFGLRQQSAEMSDPGNTVLVIDEGGTLMGYALLQACGPELEELPFHFARPLEVARFYVDRALHGAGAAQALMTAVLSHAASEGHDGVWLQVWEQNPRAIRFYAKAGFTDVGDATFRIGEQVDRDRVLIHTLMVRGL